MVVSLARKLTACFLLRRPGTTCPARGLPAASRPSAAASSPSPEGRGHMFPPGAPAEPLGSFLPARARPHRAAQALRPPAAATLVHRAKPESLPPAGAVPE